MSLCASLSDSVIEDAPTYPYQGTKRDLEGGQDQHQVSSRHVWSSTVRDHRLLLSSFGRRLMERPVHHTSADVGVVIYLSG